MKKHQPHDTGSNVVEWNFNEDEFAGQHLNTSRSHTLLNYGDVIQEGDEYRDPHTGKWELSKSIGRKVGIPYCTNLTYRRLIK